MVKTQAKTIHYVSIENEILMHFRSIKKSASDVSLSDATGNDQEGNALAIMDVISCEDTGLLAIEQNDCYKQLHKLVDTLLDPREKQIIMLRYGMNGNDPLTQREVAKKLNISRS